MMKRSLQFFAEGRERRRNRSGLNLNWKLLAIIGGAVVALVVLILVLSSALSSGAKFETMDRNPQPIVFDDDTLYFLTDGGKIDSRLDAEVVSNWVASIDGNVAYFTVDEEGDGEEVLCILSGEDILWVSDNPEQIMMNETGTAVAYIIDEELYLYAVSKKNASKLTSNVLQISAVSPDGKAIAYVDMEGYACLYMDGKIIDLDPGVEVVSLSDSGKYIYCIGEDEDGVNCLYLYSSKGFVGLVASGINVDEDTVYYTNADHSQLIFRAEGKNSEKWYAVENKELEEDLHVMSSNDHFEPLLPEFAQIYHYQDRSLTVIGASNLADLVYKSYDSDDTTMKLVYIGSGWGTSTLVSKVTEAQLGEDGETIYYLKSGKLFAIDAEFGAQGEQLAIGVSFYAVTKDGKGFYYIDLEGKAYYHNGSKETEVSENVDALLATHDGYALYISLGNLYITKQGKQTEMLMEEFDGVLYSYADCTYYTVIDGDSVIWYASAKGGSFKELGTQVVDYVYDDIEGNIPDGDIAE